MTLHMTRGRLAVILLMTMSAQLASANTATTIALQRPANDKSSAATENEDARLQQFLDKNGGYKDNEGGYYNPKAGTYTDAVGGKVDNWQGYTYKDGSYKSILGDYWDEPTKTFKLANGETLKSEETTQAEAIKLLRDNVEEHGGYYNKNGIQSAMMARIKAEHPLTPEKTRKRP